MLEEEEADHGHQRVIVEAAPRTALEVIEPELFFELLVDLLAGPASLDCAGDGLERSFGGMIGEMVFGLSNRATFRYEPDIFSGQMNAVGGFRAIGSAHANGAEVSGEWPLRPITPRDATPSFWRQLRDDVLGASVNVCGQGAGTGSTNTSSTWHASPSVGWIELVLAGDSDSPGERQLS